MLHIILPCPTPSWGNPSPPSHLPLRHLRHTHRSHPEFTRTPHYTSCKIPHKHGETYIWHPHNTTTCYITPLPQSRTIALWGVWGPTFTQSLPEGHWTPSLLAAGASRATPVRPLHTSPLLHVQARTCSRWLLSQLWSSHPTPSTTSYTAHTHTHNTKWHTTYIHWSTSGHVQSKWATSCSTRAWSRGPHKLTHALWMSPTAQSTGGPRSAPHWRPHVQKNDYHVAYPMKSQQLKLYQHSAELCQ